MARYELVDEATIQATPEEIVAALEDESTGRSHWWLPWLQLTQHGGLTYCEVGGVVGFKVNGHGHVERRWGTARFQGRVTAVEPARRITVEYFDGDFRGTTEWTFDKVDDTHTHVAFHWHTNPTGPMRLWARLFDIASVHSAVMRQGFAAIEAYAAEQRVRRTGSTVRSVTPPGSDIHS